MRALIGIGSNIEPRKNVEAACQRLAQDSTVVAQSRSWWTPAVGSDGPPFLNRVAIVDTARRPVALRRWLQAIELDQRRIRTHDRNAPRTLDLDVLGIDAGNGWELAPDLAAQPFHLLPLREVLPTLQLPDGRTVKQAAADQPLPGATPWMEGSRARPLERPATFEGR